MSYTLPSENPQILLRINNETGDPNVFANLHDVYRDFAGRANVVDNLLIPLSEAVLEGIKEKAHDLKAKYKAWRNRKT